MHRATLPIFIILFHCLSASGQTQTIKTYYDQKDSLLKEEITIDIITNKLSGPYKKYHQNGSEAVLGCYQSNKADSIWTFFFESGRIKTKGEYKLGNASGEWIYYFENGNVKSKGHYVNEKPNDVWHYFYENGNLKREATFNEGIPNGKWTYYYETGPIKATTLYKADGLGSHLEFDLNGSKIAEGKKQGLHSEGNWTYYYATGEKKSIGRFLEGNKHGEWTSYYSSGAIQSKGNFAAGEKIGEWSYYHENGSLMSVGKMSENQMDGEWKVYTPKGQIMSTGEYTLGTGPVTTYHANGQIASYGYLKDGLMDSTWRYFNENGVEVATADYDENLGIYTGLYPDGQIRLQGKVRGNTRIGEWKIYDPNGKLNGTYHPIYDENEQGSSPGPLPIISKIDVGDLDAEITDYKYQKKENRYFDEIVNEFDAWIFSSNPLKILLGRLPFSIEYYQQERLGYELIYQHIRSPFTYNSDNIDIDQLHTVGHSISFKQKFYSRAKPLGMFYFGHQLLSESSNFAVKTQESGGFRNIVTSNAKASILAYGWMIGWKFMKDAGEPGLSIDGYVGQNIGIRSWQLTEINDENSLTIFDEVNQEPLALPISFGLNVGWAFEHQKRKRRRK